MTTKRKADFLSAKPPYLINGVPPLDIEAMATSKGAVRVYGVDFGTQDLNKTVLLDGIRKELAFPEGMGKNWDSLLDALSDMSWEPAGGYVIHIRYVRTSDDSLITFATIVNEVGKLMSKDKILFKVYMSIAP